MTADRELPENEETITLPPSLSWEEAATLNHRNLVLTAAWVHEEEDIEEIFGLSPDEFERWSQYEGELTDLIGRMSNELLRITMSVLCQARLENKGEPTKQGFPVNELAGLITTHGTQDAKNKRLGRVLKTLRRAGYIQGYEERETPSTKGYDVQISGKGLSAHLNYLARCKEEGKEFDGR